MELTCLGGSRLRNGRGTAGGTATRPGPALPARAPRSSRPGPTPPLPSAQLPSPSHCARRPVATRGPKRPSLPPTPFRPGAQGPLLGLCRQPLGSLLTFLPVAEGLIFLQFWTSPFSIPAFSLLDLPPPRPVLSLGPQDHAPPSAGVSSLDPPDPCALQPRGSPKPARPPPPLT